MKPRTLRILILLGLAIVSSGTIWRIIHEGHEEIWSLYYHLAVELLGGVITIILFDMIIGSRQRRSEAKTLLMRDLYSDEEEIRILALDQLLTEKLLLGAILNNVDFTTLNLKNKVFEEITFFKCKFFGSQLENAAFKKCKFIKTNFQGANLNSSTILNCTVSESNFSDSFFENSSIGNTTFDNCNLDSSKFTKSNILNSSFVNCTSNLIVISEVNIDEISGETFAKENSTFST